MGGRARGGHPQPPHSGLIDIRATPDAFRLYHKNESPRSFARQIFHEAGNLDRGISDKPDEVVLGQSGI